MQPSQIQAKGIVRKFLPYIFGVILPGRHQVNSEIWRLGLGMAIVYQLVEAHGGRVTAESLARERSLFHCEASLLKAPIKEQHRNLRKANPLISRGIRLLIIDDDPEQSRDHT